MKRLPDTEAVLFGLERTRRKMLGEPASLTLYTRRQGRIVMSEKLPISWLISDRR
jgi:hypothetical protein